MGHNLREAQADNPQKHCGCPIDSRSRQSCRHPLLRQPLRGQPQISGLSNVTFLEEAPAVRWSATSPPYDVAAARGMPTSIWRPRPTRPSTAAAASTACVGCGSPCGRAWAHVGDVDGGYSRRWAYDRDSCACGPRMCVVSSDQSSSGVTERDLDRRRVLYLIVCAAAPASQAGALVELAQAAQWDVWAIATHDATAFIDLDELAARTGHPV